MKRCYLFLTFLSVSIAAWTGSWYSIDGFTLYADGIGIGPPDAMSEFISFRFDGSEDPAVGARLVAVDDGPLSERDMATIQAVSMIRAMAGREAAPIESVEVRPHATGRNVSGFFVTVHSGGAWQEAFVIDLEQTPGGAYRYVILFPLHDGEAGSPSVDQLLRVLRVEIEDAAG